MCNIFSRISLLLSCLILVADREAYYAVLSLLVDRADIPAGTRLTAANCEGFVPSEDRLLLDVLQKYVFRHLLC